VNIDSAAIDSAAIDSTGQAGTHRSAVELRALAQTGAAELGEAGFELVLTIASIRLLTAHHGGARVVRNWPTSLGSP